MGFVDVALQRAREALSPASWDSLRPSSPEHRAAVLAGTATAWAAPDLSELIEIPGRVPCTVGDLDAYGCRLAMQALTHRLVPLARKLHVKLHGDGSLDRPLLADDFAPEQRADARQINALSLVLRAVHHRMDEVTTQEDARLRMERDRHTLALHRLLDEGPAALDRINARLAGLEDASAGVARLLADLRLLASARALIDHAERLRAAIPQAAAALGTRTPTLPPAPGLPEEFDLLGAERVAHAVMIRVDDPVPGVRDLLGKARAALQQQEDQT